MVSIYLLRNCHTDSPFSDFKNQVKLLKSFIAVDLVKEFPQLLCEWQTGAGGQGLSGKQAKERGERGGEQQRPSLAP